MPKTISDAETSPWLINDSPWTWVLESTGSLSVDGTAIVEDKSESGNTVTINGDIHSNTEQQGSVAFASAGSRTAIDVGTTSLIDTETGFVFTGVAQRLSNSGLIHVDGTGVTGSLNLTNEGEITGTDGLNVFDTAIVNQAGALIHGTDTGIVSHGNGWGLGTTAITNYGTISGDVAAISSDGNILHLNNYGHITGDVDLSGGNDILTFHGSSRMSGQVDAGDGDDWFYIAHGAKFSDSISGGGGNDYYDFTGGRNRVHISEAADGGTDRVYASFSYTLAENIETLFLFGHRSIIGIGNDQDNTIVGAKGHDTLIGMGGDDVLLNSQGSNFLLIGGAGDDTFAFDRHKSTVQDFTDGEDKLAFTDSSGITSFDKATIEQHGDDTWIGYTNHSGFHLRAILDNTDAATLTASDFEFHFDLPR